MSAYKGAIVVYYDANLVGHPAIVSEVGADLTTCTLNIFLSGTSSTNNQSRVVPRGNPQTPNSWDWGVTRPLSIPDADGQGQYSLYTVTPWKNVTLGAGWSNVAGFATAQCRILPGGDVAFKGVIAKTLAIAMNEVIFTIPVGMRPKEQRQRSMPVYTNGTNMQRFLIKPNGEVIYSGTAAISFSTIQLSLDILRSDAEQ